MQTRCARILDSARELLRFGVVGEGADHLLGLRRCAHRLGCSEWQDCSCRVDGAWRDESEAARDLFVLRARRRR